MHFHCSIFKSFPYYDKICSISTFRYINNTMFSSLGIIKQDIIVECTSKITKFKPLKNHLFNCHSITCILYYSVGWATDYCSVH